MHLTKKKWEGPEGKQQCLDQLLDKLKGDEAPQIDEEEVEKMYITMLFLLNEPEIDSSMVLKWYNSGLIHMLMSLMSFLIGSYILYSLVLYSEFFCKPTQIGVKLFENIISNNKETAARAKTAFQIIIEKIPLLPSHFGAEFLEGIIPEFIQFIPMV